MVRGNPSYVGRHRFQDYVKAPCCGHLVWYESVIDGRMDPKSSHVCYPKFNSDPPELTDFEVMLLFDRKEMSMPARNFCDRCDDEMEVTNPYYLVNLKRTNDDNYTLGEKQYTTYTMGERGPRAAYHNIEAHANMLCAKCATEIAKFIRRHNQEIENGVFIRHTGESRG